MIVSLWPVQGTHTHALDQAKTHLLLHILLQPWLPNQPKDCRGQRVAHEWDGAPEKRGEILRRGLAKDFHDGLLSTSSLHKDRA